VPQALHQRTDTTPAAIAERIDSVALFGRWQEQEDHEAREQLVERFLPLARKLARRYSGAHEPFDDLLQVASLGLVKAIDRFDTDRGTAFSGPGRVPRAEHRGGTRRTRDGRRASHRLARLASR